MQKKVLIVDDSPAQVKLIQGLLEPEGYWPVGLSDPKRVEEAIAIEKPNVILLDVVMPERNGFQVCRELKGNIKFNAIPVILVTSKDTASDRYWGQQQGADGYVTKPFHARGAFARGSPFRLMPYKEHSGMSEDFQLTPISRRAPNSARCWKPWLR